MNIIQNKIVFITGASSGIGKACAEIFAEKGAKLLLCARRLDRLEQLKNELVEKFACNVYVFELDVRDRQQVNDKLNSLTAEWQKIDVLINNAGLSRGLNKIQEGSYEDWDEMIDTNIKGLLNITRAVLPGMLLRNSGHVINVGSLAGHEVYPNGNVYCATKHAVRALNKGMKLDLLGTNVRATSVDPGLAETEFSKVGFRGDEEKAGKVYEGITPLTPQDIAETILFCATRPPHVNISEVLLMPTDQSGSTFVHRKE